MDALTDLLKTIRLHTSAYFCSDFNLAWSMLIPAAKSGVFHTLLEGQCWLHIDSQSDAIFLEAGDIVAFPTGGSHRLSSEKDMEAMPAQEVIEGIHHGNNPFFDADLSAADSANWSTLMCGAFEYDSSIDHPFIRDLPCFIHIRAKDSPELDWLRSLIRVVAMESRDSKPGSVVIVDRLTEVLFIQLLRVYMQNSDLDACYLKALNDPKIGKALNLIHSEKIASLSVETLAQSVALSRSAFSERFTRLVGEAPKTYLQRWRFEVAKQALQDGQASILSIALNAGYRSEAAFSKAFKLHAGHSPGSYRKILKQATSP